MVFLTQFKNFFKTIDIFGARVELYVKNESSFKTAFSGFLTFLLFGFILFLTVTKFWVLVTRSEITQIERIKNSPAEGEFFIGNPQSKNTIMIALGFSNPKLNDLVNITLLARTNSRNTTTGALSKVRRAIALEKCTHKHFPSLDNDFISLGLGSYLCPKLTEPLKISGTFTDNEFNFFQILVNDCSNTSICSDSAAAQDFYKNGVSADISIFVTTDEIDPEDNDKPIKKKITSEIHFILDNKQNSRLLKTADIFLRTMKLNFDKEVFLPIPNNEEFFGVMFASEIKEQVTSTDNKELGNFYIRKSPYIIEVERQFYTFGEFFSYLGGAWSQMFILIYFICTFYNKRRYLAKLANRIYKLDIEENELQTRSSKINSDFKDRTDTKVKGSIDSSLMNDKVAPVREMIRNITNFLKRDSTVKFSFLDLFFGFLMKFVKTRDKKLKVLKTSFESISEDLDLIKMLKAQQDIEKLKRLLLTGQQLKLFDYSPKPNISLGGRAGKGKRITKLLKAVSNPKVSPNVDTPSKGRSKMVRMITTVLFRKNANTEHNSDSIPDLIFAYYQTKKRLQDLPSDRKTPHDDIDENLLQLIESDIKMLKSLMSYSENEILNNLKLHEPSLLIPLEKPSEENKNALKNQKCNFLVHGAPKEK